MKFGTGRFFFVYCTPSAFTVLQISCNFKSNLHSYLGVVTCSFCRCHINPQLITIYNLEVVPNGKGKNSLEAFRPTGRSPTLPYYMTGGRLRGLHSFSPPHFMITFSPHFILMSPLSLCGPTATPVATLIKVEMWRRTQHSVCWVVCFLISFHGAAV